MWQTRVFLEGIRYKKKNWNKRHNFYDDELWNRDRVSVHDKECLFGINYH